MSQPQYQAVEGHYDALIDLYEQLWGEHLHHGYWGDGVDQTRAEAQERMVRELVSFSGLRPGGYVLDAGCGTGAPAFYLADALNCRVEAVTLSRNQVDVGSSRAREAGLADAVTFHQMNVLDADFPDQTFDVVWAVESVELMPDKAAFFARARRLLRPGGLLVVAVWCRRTGAVEAADEPVLRRVYRDFEIPYILPLDEIHRLCHTSGFEDVDSADWTDNASRTWDLTPEVEHLLRRDPDRVLDLARERGVAVLRFFDGLPAMNEAYATGAMRYGVLKARKPVTSPAPAS